MESLRRSLPREVASVRPARKEIRAQMIDAGRPPPHVDVVEYVVGELVSESVEHGAGPMFLLVVSVDVDRTRVEVTDGLSLAGKMSPLRERILDAIVSAKGVTDISGGRSLWAEVDV